MHPINQTLRNLVSDERGNVAITFGLTSMIAMAAVGGAVDFGRAYQHKSRMQNALDAAVVSGVSKLKDTGNAAQAQTTALATFRAVYNNALNPTTANPNPTATREQPIVNFTQNGTTIVGRASMKANTPFMKFAIGSDLTVAADSSGTPPSGKILEIAVMMDLTGSMGWNAATGATATACNAVSSPSKKIDYLKCAGEDLLNILLPSSGANNANVRVGIAPFADYVNAGSYAAAVTGLAETGGTYSNLTNLANTRQTGTFSGTYSSVGAQTSGSQFGATGSTVPTGARSTVAAGGTYVSTHCETTTNAAQAAVAGTLATTSIMKVDSGNHYVGRPVTVTLPAGTAQPQSILYANTGNAPTSTGRKYKQLTKVDYYTGGSNDGNLKSLDTSGAQTSGYYVPVITDESGLTKKMRNSGGNNGPVGVWVNRDDTPNSSTAGQTGHAGIRRIGSGTGDVTGYWKVSTHNGTDWTDYTWVTTAHEHFVQVYEVVETGAIAPQAATTKAECVDTVVSQPVSKLISCVTERVDGAAGGSGTLNYTADAIASNKYIGAYNHGVTTGSNAKSNYSADGKCWVGGRELPPVQPLTNDRTALMEYFTTKATVGGATPGHLGTAWASYILSPNFNTIWPSSAATAYNTSNVTKAAILMTDGEYNLTFSSNAGSTTANSHKQALMLCQQMRNNGIKVYTVGFGFGDNAQPPHAITASTDRTTPLGGTATSKDKALDTLAKCASDNASYYFPYDGQALREAFKAIANGLTSDLTSGKARLTN